MKRYTLLSAALSLALLLSGCGSPKENTAAPQRPEDLYAMTVRTLENRDFPSAPGLSCRELEPEVASVLDYAQENGFNSLFFQVRPAGDAFYKSELFPTSAFWTRKQGGLALFSDPLASLVKQAAEREIGVYAVVDPFYLGKQGDAFDDEHPAVLHPDWVLDLNGSLYLDPTVPGARALIAQGAGEIAANYSVWGVVLQPMAPALREKLGPEALLPVLRETADAVHTADPSVSFGLMADALPEEDLLPEESSLDLLVPAMTLSASDPKGGFDEALERWQALAERSGAELVPLLTAENLPGGGAEEPLFTDPFELEYQYSAMTGAGVLDLVLDNYSALRVSPMGAAARIQALRGEHAMPEADVDLSIHADELTITRPVKPIQFDYPTYFITGISDPELPLTLNGEEVERNTESGLFGVQVNLLRGKNVFTFRQGSQSRTVTITRPWGGGGGGGASLINRITAGSMVPSTPSLAQAGEPFTLRCVAPAGGTVVARVGDQAVTLRQVAAASRGVPATYSAKITLAANASPAQEVTKLGPVQYTLTYNGAKNTYKSQSDLYVAGKDAVPVLETVDYMAGVLPSNEPKDEGNFITNFPAGIRDVIVGEEGGSFELASGGFVKKSAVQILEGKAKAGASVSAGQLLCEEQREILTLVGGAHLAYHDVLDENTLTFTLFNVEQMPESLPSAENSELLSSISAETEGSTVTLTLTLRKPLWGYDLRCTENDLQIVLNKAPVLSRVPGKPLTGVSVVLDPGHGGIDPGALGIAGSLGPDEAVVNMAAANMTRDVLENLGATVTMTRHSVEQDKNVLFQRMELTDQADPDLFISLHHNSTHESADSRKFAGSEVYYYTESSHALAQNIVDLLARAVDRPNRGALQSYYIVTKRTDCPAVLTEIGFMVNPAEYEQLLDETTLRRTAASIAGAVVETIRTFPSSF